MPKRLILLALVPTALAMVVLATGCGSAMVAEPTSPPPTDRLPTTATPVPAVAALEPAVAATAPVTTATPPAATATVPVVAATASPAEPARLVVLHTNDTWGETEPCG